MDFSSIKTKIRVGIVGIIIFILLMLLSTVISSSFQKSDATVINIAGKQRMLSQKMSKEVNAIALGLCNEKDLIKTAELFKKSLNGLINGDSKLGLPPTKDEEILSQLTKVKNIWAPFYKNIKTFIEDPETNKEIISYIDTHNIELLTEMNKAVKMYEEVSSSKITVLITIQVIFFIMTIFLGFFAEWFAKDRFINIIEELDEAANRIADGDANINIEPTSTSEFNELIHSFNTMTENIELAQQKLLEEKIGVEIKVKEAVNEIEDQKIYLANSIKNILEKMNSFAGGDLGVKLLVEKDDDIGQLFNGFNLAVENIRKMIEDLVNAVHQTSSSANMIGQATDELAAGAEELSSQSREVAAAVEEMTQSIHLNANTATETVKVSSENGKVANEGGTIVKKTVNKIDEITNVIHASTKTVEKLGDSSNKIGEIIDVISEIADQTNLLALNAAIEAARAGEHGRGFAVVADEVKNLAERTSKATQEITSMIKNIQVESESAVNAMQNGNVAIKEGSSYAGESGEALEKIVVSTNKVIDLINQTAVANEEQSETSQQISQSVESISEVAEKSAKDISQIAYETRGLMQIVEDLEQNINSFKLT